MPRQQKQPCIALATTRLSKTGCARADLGTRNPTQEASSTAQPTTRQRWQHHKRPRGEQADHEGANTTNHRPNRCRNNDPTINRPHANPPTPNQVGMQGSKQKRRPRVEDTKVRHARGQQYPQTQRRTATLTLYNRPTNGKKVLRTPAPLGERKLDRVNRREHTSRHASPVARASSSCLTPTENQPRWGCLQDKVTGLAPLPWAPQSGG